MAPETLAHIAAAEPAATSRPVDLVATSACALVDLLAGDLHARSRMTDQERADALARGLATGIVRALKEGDSALVVPRLRALAAWVTRAADRIEATSPVPVPSPEAVPGALAKVDARRVA